MKKVSKLDPATPAYFALPATECTTCIAIGIHIIFYDPTTTEFKGFQLKRMYSNCFAMIKVSKLSPAMAT